MTEKGKELYEYAQNMYEEKKEISLSYLEKLHDDIMSIETALIVAYEEDKTDNFQIKWLFRRAEKIKRLREKLCDIIYGDNIAWHMKILWQKN